MQFEQLKYKGQRGELWIAKPVPGTTVSYGWTWISPNSGAAFAKNHGTSGVRFEIVVSSIANDRRDVVVEQIVDRVRYMSDARSAARKYIKTVGKAQAIAIAEAVVIDSQV